jgi:microcystin-dependent protein
VSSPFVAEIRILPYNFAPTGWATCDGQLLPISQNTALFSLLGTIYGGDGKSNFALPNLQDSTPLGVGQGQGLSDRVEGESAGEPFVTLLDSEMTLHNHVLSGNNTQADSALPTNNAIARYSAAAYQTPPAVNPQPMAFQGLPVQGSSLPHNNMQPYVTLQYCIALQGVFPARP